MISVAIDGPAGAGKSTVAKEVSAKLNYIYVDTGAMYRTLALACLRNNIDSGDEENIVKICKASKVSIKYENGEQIMFLNGENVNDYIRTEQVSSMTSIISAYGQVRETLIEMQRNLAKENNIIMDGRDIGTHVLPGAKVKIYLTASAKTRARRRYKQLLEKGISGNPEEIEKEIMERDTRDMNREVAPLKIAEDAVYIDTSDMSQIEVVNSLVELIKSRI